MTIPYFILEENNIYEENTKENILSITKINTKIIYYIALTNSSSPDFCLQIRREHINKVKIIG
jgi:hypothetical protein